MTLPASPSSASISRSIVPLPIPPKLGLQEQVPRFSIFGVTSNVLAPTLAAAALASAPACPPPMTITSKGLDSLSVRLPTGTPLHEDRNADLELSVTVARYRRRQAPKPGCRGRLAGRHKARMALCRSTQRRHLPQKWSRDLGRAKKRNSRWSRSTRFGIRLYGNMQLPGLESRPSSQCCLDYYEVLRTSNHFKHTE